MGHIGPRQAVYEVLPVRDTEPPVTATPRDDRSRPGWLSRATRLLKR